MCVCVCVCVCERETEREVTLWLAIAAEFDRKHPNALRVPDEHHATCIPD